MPRFLPADAARGPPSTAGALLCAPPDAGKGPDMTERRGNGLLADSYVPLLLLTPALADTMLEALGRAGIAAYAVTVGPAAESADTEATDRLYVDAKERAAAVTVLRAELPELADRVTEGADQAEDAEPSPNADTDPDEVWADLVARYYTSDASESTWPEIENVSDRPEPEDPDDAEDHVLPPRPFHPPVGEPADVDDSDQERYVPPPPPPLPRGDLVGRLAWAGLLGGPVLLLVITLLGMAVPGWLVLVALCSFVTGFVVLLIRMGDQPSGPDDGAVV